MGVGSGSPVPAVSVRSGRVRALEGPSVRPWGMSRTRGPRVALGCIEGSGQLPWGVGGFRRHRLDGGVAVGAVEGLAGCEARRSALGVPQKSTGPRLGPSRSTVGKLRSCLVASWAAHRDRRARHREQPEIPTCRDGLVDSLLHQMRSRDDPSSSRSFHRSSRRSNHAQSKPDSAASPRPGSVATHVVRVVGRGQVWDGGVARASVGSPGCLLAAKVGRVGRRIAFRSTAAGIAVLTPTSLGGL